MAYTFEIVSVSPVLSFFNHQQKKRQHNSVGTEYVGAYQCTLDAFLASVETVPSHRDWELDAVVDTVVKFWLNHAEQVKHWKQRLEDAGAESLLVARVGDLRSFQVEFERLLGQNF
jgi:hypothetical protein